MFSLELNDNGKISVILALFFISFSRKPINNTLGVKNHFYNVININHLPRIRTYH